MGCCCYILGFPGISSLCLSQRIRLDRAVQTPGKCVNLIQCVAWAYFAFDADGEGAEKRSTSVTFLGPFWLTAEILAPSVLLLQLFGEAESDFLVFFFPNFSFIFLT